LPVRWPRRLFVLLLAVLVWVEPARSQINLNLQDADVLELVRIMSEATGRTFVPHEGLAGARVTIVSPGALSLAEAYRTFQTILRLRGFAAVEENGVVKIVPLQDVRTEAIPTTIEAAPAGVPSGAFVTHVEFLQHASAEELANLLRPLLSPTGGLIVADPSSNALLLVDTGDNVRRLLRIVTAIDVAGRERRMEIFFLQYASAREIAETLTSILTASDPRQVSSSVSPGGLLPAGPAGGPPAPPAVVADERTNSVLVYGTADQIALAATMIASLDRPATVERAMLHVYRVRHANAQHLAEVLGAQVRAAAEAGSEAPAPSAAGAANAATTQVIGQFESRVTIAADPATNSLVVAATPEDYRVLRAVVEQLDERRAQVLVEALILEATTSASRRLGVELRFPLDPDRDGLQPIGGTTLPVGTDPSVIGSVTQNPLSPPGGLVVGAVEGFIEINGIEILNIAGLVRALQSDNSFNILSTPHTMTLDNQEAEIVVGEERPFLRSQQSTDVGTLVSTFDFREIGIKLRVTPRISVDGTVQMDLYVEITNFVSEAQGTVGAVTTTKRAVTTAVVVDSGQMAVIGGLMQDQQDRAASRVPCLGSIPVAGWLFKSTARDARKTNLLIFIQPRILLDREGIEQLRREKSAAFEEAKPREQTVGGEAREIIDQLETRPPQ
jgi:general secretion pathway protein D